MTDLKIPKLCLVVLVGVSGFTGSDVTLTGGTRSKITPVSARKFTFNVTPSGTGRPDFPRVKMVTAWPASRATRATTELRNPVPPP